jgi:hypothetical protein
MKIRRHAAAGRAYDLREGALFARTSPQGRTGPPTLVIVRRNLKCIRQKRTWVSPRKAGQNQGKSSTKEIFLPDPGWRGPASSRRRIVGLAANHQIHGDFLIKVKQ